jgi:hypothetical protein
LVVVFWTVQDSARALLAPNTATALKSKAERNVGVFNVGFMALLIYFQEHSPPVANF